VGDGSYAFTATASDAAGNVSALSHSLAVIIDTVAPAAPVIAGVTKSTDNSGNQILTLAGTSEPNSTVNVYLKGSLLGTVKANDHGEWNYRYVSLKFADGNYLFTASATDAAGNVGAASGSFNLLLGKLAQNLAAPKLDPSCVLGVAGDGTPQTTANPTLSGSARAGAVVTIVDGDAVLGTAVADASGRWTFICPTLAKGKHDLAVYATDALGNSGLLSAALTIQV
jgi:hypothetical protein